jgi:hypothetical protein
MRPLYRQSLVFWLTIYPILPASAQDRPLDPSASSAATLALKFAGLTDRKRAAQQGSGWMSSGSTIANVPIDKRGHQAAAQHLPPCPDGIGRAEDAPASALCW